MTTVDKKKLTLMCAVAALLVITLAPSMKAEAPCRTQGSEREDAQAIPENRGLRRLPSHCSNFTPGQAC